MGRHEAYQEANSAEMRASRSLKTGMDSAMIHAITQPTRMIAIQDPTASQVRLDMCWVPRKRRTYLVIITVSSNARHILSGMDLHKFSSYVSVDNAGNDNLFVKISLCVSIIVRFIEQLTVGKAIP